MLNVLPLIATGRLHLSSDWLGSSIFYQIVPRSLNQNLIKTYLRFFLCVISFLPVCCFFCVKIKHCFCWLMFLLRKLGWSWFMIRCLLRWDDSGNIHWIWCHLLLEWGTVWICCVHWLIYHNSDHNKDARLFFQNFIGLILESEIWIWGCFTSACYIYLWHSCRCRPQVETLLDRHLAYCDAHFCGHPDVGLRPWPEVQK